MQDVFQDATEVVSESVNIFIGYVNIYEASMMIIFGKCGQV